MLSKEQKIEFEKLSKAMMKFLCDNFNPHVHVIIEPTSAELSFGESAIATDEFVKD